MKRTVVATIDGEEVGRYTIAYDGQPADKIAPSKDQLISRAKGSMKRTGMPGRDIAKAQFHIET